MKRLLASIVMLIACANVHAQAISCDGGQAKVQQIVEMQGKSAADVYKLAQRWVALSFHNKDKVVQTEIENELIRGDGYEPKSIKLGLLSIDDMSYSFSVEIKEGKLRFTLYNIVVHVPQEDLRNPSFVGEPSRPIEFYVCGKASAGIRDKAKKSVDGFASQLITSLNTALSEKKDDNW